MELDLTRGGLFKLSIVAPDEPCMVTLYGASDTSSRFPKLSFVLMRRMLRKHCAATDLGRLPLAMTSQTSVPGAKQTKVGKRRVGQNEAAVRVEKRANAQKQND